MRARDVLIAIAVSLTLLAFIPTAALAEPTASIDPTISQTLTTAKVSGTITTDTASETYFGFQVRPVLTGKALADQEETEAAEAAEEEGTKVPQVNWIPGPAAFSVALGPEATFDSTTTPAITESFTNLHAGTEYEARLVAFPFSDFKFRLSPLPNPTFTTDPAPVEPTLALDPAQDVTDTTATISGSIDPEGGNTDPIAGPIPINWRLELQREDGDWTARASGTLTEAEATSDDPIDVPASPAELKGLLPNSTYHYRLKATYAGIEKLSAEGSFQTDAVPPVIGPEVSTPEGPGVATIRAYVNPRNSAITQCVFEYGLTASYGQSVPCEGDPNGPGPFGSEPPARVSAHLTGLTPGATYHYRLVVDNGVGPEVSGSDEIVRSAASPEDASCLNADKPGAGFLPDCRAYEMVSPPDKRGGDVIQSSDRTRLAVDGSAASFASLVAFGDAIGTGVATDYMALRNGKPGTSGWSTHAITPRQEPLSAREASAFDSHYGGDLSDDLNRGVIRTHTPLSDDPNVAEVTNFYIRNDLLSPGMGTYQLASGCPLCEQSGPLPPLGEETLAPQYAGASDDFSHVLFEERINLTEDTPAQPDACLNEPSDFNCKPRVYEWAGGQTHLVGLVPAGSDTTCGGSGAPCVAAEVSLPAQGVGLNPSARPLNAISDDGSRVFFTVPTDGNGNVAEGNQGRVYMREDAARTVQLNASERTDCADDPSCGGDGVPDAAPVSYSPATYLTAADDGSRVFFSTSEGLTDNAQTSGARSVYMYDTTKSASDPHNLTYINFDEAKLGVNDLRAVIGASEDGRYVYFITTGQIVAGEPSLEGGLGVYMWHEGQISYIGQASGGVPDDLTIITGNYYVPAQSRISADGRNILLGIRDTSGFAGSRDQTSFRHLYLYSAATHELTCVSCAPDGEAPKADAAVGVLEGKSVTTVSSHLSRAITEDGKYVFFTSGDPLLPEDTNGKNDAYEYNVETGELHLLSGGTDKADSYFLQTDPDGKNALFVTRQQLVGWDKDTSYDLYNARIGGGFPEPPPLTDPCSGDSCRESAPANPSLAPKASANFSGPGNRRANRCRKGRRAVRVKGKIRCTKPNKGQKQMRDAKHSRRASQ